MRFRRLTPQQRSTLDALRALGSITVTPQVARPLKALKKRGLVRYKRDADGVRTAILRDNKVTRRAGSREQRWTSRVWEYLHSQGTEVRPS